MWYVTKALNYCPTCAWRIERRRPAHQRAETKGRKDQIRSLSVGLDAKVFYAARTLGGRQPANQSTETKVRQSPEARFNKSTEVKVFFWGRSPVEDNQQISPKST